MMETFQDDFPPAAKAELMAAVISQAAADLQEQDEALRKDAERFFKSDWFDHICGSLDLPECREEYL